ncbi:glucose-6-phosphate dehydrogenase, partial [Mesorhizobium sp. M00.F.Ca.ET.186.01.1.1]
MEPMSFVLFGATGDLAKRKIYLALFNLYVDDKLPGSFSIVGVGRRAWSDQEFVRSVEQSIREFSRRDAIDQAQLERFLAAFSYAAVDVTKA